MYSGPFLKCSHFLGSLGTTTGQVGFMATQRVDGKLILSEAIKVLAQKAAG